MTNQSKSSVVKGIFALLFILLPLSSAFAQEDFEDDVDDETPQAFIDGFVGLGLAAGAIYGYSKLKKNQ